MITCLLTCKPCGLVDARVEVPARTDAQDAKAWFRDVLTPTLTRFHQQHSPFCKNRTMTNVKIPIPNKDNARIGEQTDSIPPLGEPRKETP